MSATKMYLTVSIDIGMSGSAAEWWTHPKEDSGSIGTPHLIGKIPTVLAYGPDGEVIAWGSACNDINPSKLCRSFKTAFNDAAVLPPQHLQQVKKWTADYLREFGIHIIHAVAKEERVSRKDLVVEWHLTTPGCWSVSIQRDFRELASRVLLDLTPNAKVVVDLTEGRTSCEYLLDTLGLAFGTWVLTCDIGGATADISLALIKAEQGNHGVLIPEVYSVPSVESGRCNVTSIDAEFQRVANVKEDVVNTSWWQSTRHSFDGSNEVVLPAQYSSSDVHLSTIKIPSADMEECFEGFLTNVSSEIDKALQRLGKIPEHGQKPVIALCGGGGTIQLLVKRLNVRFSDYKIMVPESTENSCLATVLGHRIYLTRAAINTFLKEVHGGFSAESSKDPIKWDNLSRLTSFHASSKKTHASYYFVVKHITDPGPPTARDVIVHKAFGPWPGTLVWKLSVVLGKHFVTGRKYSIEATCVGRNQFSFRAFDADKPEIPVELVSDFLRGVK